MTTRISITVGGADLRAALTSVLPHRDDKDSVLCRIRLEVRPDRNLYVYATDRYTAALALVSVWDDAYADPDPQYLDIFPDDAKKILAVFKAEKGKDAIDDSKIGIVYDGAALTLTDQSGLFPDADQKLTLPLPAPLENYPDILRMISRMVVNAMSGEVPGSPHLQLAPALVNRFRAAAAAYSRLYVLSRSGEARAALLVRVGESFLGALMPAAMTDEDQAVFDADIRAWQRRLPVPADVPIRMPEPRQPDGDDADA